MIELPPVPMRMAHRPRDARGLPIPYAQFIASDGTPDFRVLDDVKVRHCLRARLCGLCGGQMGRHIFFVGGPLCVENGLFHDVPMHKECAEFALRACAHLNRSKGKYSAAPRPSEPGLRVVEGAMATDEKAEWFALMHTTGYTTMRGSDGMVYIRADLPWRDVQKWRDGAPMEDTHGEITARC
jgi:hypothetical protein